MQSKEVLLDLGDFPVFIGCVDSSFNPQLDLFHPMLWGFKEDGTFGVINPPDPSLIYLNQHNELVGDTWVKHLEKFSLFVSNFIDGDVLEIGAGHCKLVDEVFKLNNKFTTWDIVEPNPLKETNVYGNIIKDFFPNNINKKYNTIINSHVLEHVQSAIEFLNNCYDHLSDYGQMIISIPNMKSMLDNNDLNLLMFEHLTYLPVHEVLALAEHTGFHVDNIEYFNSHSIFIKMSKVKKENGVFKTSLSKEEIDSIITSYSKNILNKVKLINSFLENNKNFYIFGAHIFTQFLIQFGLNKEKLKGVVDNSKSKHNKRLYGTNLIVSSIEDILKLDNVALVLPAGNYEEELIKQIKLLTTKEMLVYSFRSGLIKINNMI
jgi:predicted SAM-dependent methyltransferase